ncbi:MAG: flavin reductase family protein [Proteobacteria bacterium]|nr:flavin reductase family protein [Pseudomonadota bacterium]MBU1711094.1 flavin reductase family protein [Pseudomonadota bacterium]
MAKSNNEKQCWKPGNVLAPVPVVLVSCGHAPEWRPNIITIAWIGTVCTDPPMLSISLRRERHSYEIIQATGEFVVNIPTHKQAKITDWCGMVSGSTIDKFAESGLTQGASGTVKCPIIQECVINIECQVRHTMPLGSHTMFVAEVVGVQVSSQFIDATGKLRLDQVGLLAYGLGNYFSLGPVIDHFGFSIRKKNTRRRVLQSLR